MADPDTRLARFDAAEQAERSRPTADRSADKPAIDCVCPDEVKRTHFYLGVHFRMSQFQIGTRDLSLRIQTLPVPARNAEPFQKVGSPALPVAREHWDMDRLAEKATTVSPPAHSSGHLFDAVLTHSVEGLKSEVLIDGYEVEGVAEPRLNAVLGYALAFHVLRSMTIPHFGSGDFERECIGPPNPKLAPTEIVGVQLLFFLKAKLNGQVVIRKIVNGRIGGVVGEQEYTREKLAEVNRHTGEHCGGLFLVPNAYTVTVLVQDRGTEEPGYGRFELVEVYCDGDCLHGPDDR
jgi:hypothetical protein